MSLKKEPYALFIGGAILLLALLAINLFTLSGINGLVDSQLEAVYTVGASPAVEIVVISSDCTDCAGIDDMLTALEQSKISIVSETALDGSSLQAKALIEQHGIQRLPAIILSGETARLDLSGFEESGEALVFSVEVPPYVDANTGGIVGKVSFLLLVDDTCDACFDLSEVTDVLGDTVVVEEMLEIPFDSTEGTSLISQHGVTRIPALLASKADMDAYGLSQNLLSAGFKESKEHYLLESPTPYIEPGSGDLRGEVTLVLLKDSSCADCYDVNIHKSILSQFALFISEEKEADISSAYGQELRDKYNITKVPTAIILGDVGVYDSLAAVWRQVGSVEEDGAFVFRNLDALKVEYINLEEV